MRNIAYDRALSVGDPIDKPPSNKPDKFIGFGGGYWSIGLRGPIVGGLRGPPRATDSNGLSKTIVAPTALAQFVQSSYTVIGFRWPAPCGFLSRSPTLVSWISIRHGFYVSVLEVDEEKQVAKCPHSWSTLGASGGVYSERALVEASQGSVPWGRLHREAPNG